MINPNKGFFEKLFDLSFSSFVTPQIVGVLYILGLVSGVLFSLNTIRFAFRWGFASGVGTLVIALLSLLIYAIFLRVSLEGFVAIIRTAENTKILAEEAISRQTNSSRPIN
ncbi:MAG: DUF4282 domain-containing protein [Phormidesmis sp.]